MAKTETAKDGSGPEEVRVTIVVERGRVRAMFTKWPAGARVRAGLASLGLIAAVVAGLIIAASSGGGGAPSSGSHSLRLTDSALATQFGLRLNCARLTLVVPDGPYARVDLDHSGSCGAFGGQVTLILRRAHGMWVREFEASSWTCPIRQLPRPVATELRLCGRTLAPSQPATPAPQGTL